MYFLIIILAILLWLVVFAFSKKDSISINETSSIPRLANIVNIGLKIITGYSFLLFTMSVIIILLMILTTSNGSIKSILPFIEIYVRLIDFFNYYFNLILFFVLPLALLCGFIFYFIIRNEYAEVRLSFKNIIIYSIAAFIFLSTSFIAHHLIGSTLGVGEGCCIPNPVEPVI
jgi:hypothetical protein